VNSAFILILPVSTSDLFQPDVNVCGTYAPHEYFDLTYRTELPLSINDDPGFTTRNNIENIAYMTVNYNSDFIAHPLIASWTSPVKLRQTCLRDKKMLVYKT
jgi:hypothetical protein